MTASFPPSTIRVWQYTSTKGGLEKNLKLNSVPLPKPAPNQALVQVIALALNPVDYKPAEIPLLGRFLRPRLATPGIDIAGRIVTPATDSPFKRGQLVFGAAGTSPIAGGALTEFALADKNTIVALPAGLDPIDAATITVAGLSAYQSIIPHVKNGDHVFINGGSGGTGTFGIQIAKEVGCHVTVTCSGANVELCKSLGAEQVIDYRTQNVIEALKVSGHKFDHVVDNVGDGLGLYWGAHEYTKPQALYVIVGGTPSLGFIANILKRSLWPGFLGGGKRKVTGFFPKPEPKDLEKIGQWMREGKIRPVIDQKYAFEEAPKAFAKLRTGRAKGKIVIDVVSNTYRRLWSE